MEVGSGVGTAFFSLVKRPLTSGLTAAPSALASVRIFTYKFPPSKVRLPDALLPKESLKEKVAAFPATSAVTSASHTWAPSPLFAWLKENNPGARLNEAYSGLPVAEITPREAYNAIVDNNVELVSIENLPGRIAANSVIPYPPGIPMLLSGENFGDKNSPQVSYLRSLQSWDHHFPGFEHETEGTEIIDGIYHVMCVKA